MSNREQDIYLHNLYMDVVGVFEELYTEHVVENSKPIKFNEYMAKYASHLEIFKPSNKQFGKQAEDFIRIALSTVDDVRITNTTPAFDNFYGADFKIQQEHNGKPASLYVDVKLDTRFDTGMRYLHHSKGMVEHAYEASRFTFSFGTVHFGIKDRQHQFFKYEKPVAVMYISNFKFELKEDEMNTLALVLSNINRLLIDQGYAYRVSTHVVPNYRKLNR